jgi:hypothetical protein
MVANAAQRRMCNILFILYFIIGLTTELSSEASYNKIKNLMPSLAESA